MLLSMLLSMCMMYVCIYYLCIGSEVEQTVTERDALISKPKDCKYVMIDPVSATRIICMTKDLSHAKYFIRLKRSLLTLLTLDMSFIILQYFSTFLYDCCCVFQIFVTNIIK